MRPQRAFGLDRRLTPYNWEQSTAQFILRCVDDAEYREEFLLFHTLLSQTSLLLVSNAHVMVVDIDDQDVTWVIAFSGTVTCCEMRD